MNAIFGLVSFLGAFLLFQVQPIISKFILPWFGGSPGVWTTCMLFISGAAVWRLQLRPLAGWAPASHTGLHPLLRAVPGGAVSAHLAGCFNEAHRP